MRNNTNSEPPNAAIRDRLSLILVAAIAAACGATPPPDADFVVTYEGGGLTESYVRDSVRSLGTPQRFVLKDQEVFRSYLNDLVGLHLLAERAEQELLPTDRRLRHELRIARERLLAGAIIDAEIERRAPITEETLRQFFDENRRSFQRSARVRFRQILVPSRDLAAEAVARIDAGEAFDAVARQLSVHPSAAHGGQMGWHEIERLEPDLRAALDRLEVGGRSQPTETSFGVHVLELQERQEPEPEPFESVRDVVERRMHAVRRQEISELLLEELLAARGGELNEDRMAVLHSEITGAPSDGEDASRGEEPGDAPPQGTLQAIVGPQVK